VLSQENDYFQSAGFNADWKEGHKIIDDNIKSREFVKYSFNTTSRDKSYHVSE
jgi:hypothetical protein